MLLTCDLHGLAPSKVVGLFRNAIASTVILNVIQHFLLVERGALADLVVHILYKALYNCCLNPLVIDMRKVSIHYLKEDMKRELR